MLCRLTRRRRLSTQLFGEFTRPHGLPCHRSGVILRDLANSMVRVAVWGVQGHGQARARLFRTAQHGLVKAARRLPAYGDIPDCAVPPQVRSRVLGLEGRWRVSHAARARQGPARRRCHAVAVAARSCQRRAVGAAVQGCTGAPPPLPAAVARLRQSVRGHVAPPAGAHSWFVGRPSAASDNRPTREPQHPRPRATIGLGLGRSLRRYPWPRS